MAKRTITGTVEIDGKEHEVEVPVPDGMVLMSQHTFDAEMTRRAQSVSTTAVEEAMTGSLKDENHLKLAIDAARKAGLVGSEESDEDVAARIKAARDAVVTEQVTPLEVRIKAQDERIGSLLTSRLHGQILGSATGVKESLRKAAQQGALPPIVAMVEQMFGYSEEHDAYFLKDGKDGFAFSGDPKTGLPYRTVDETLSEWLGAPEQKDLLDDIRQRGPEMGTGETTRADGHHEISRDDARVHAKFRAAKAAADKAGVELRIEPATV